MILQHGNDAVGEWVFWDPVGERARVDAAAALARLEMQSPSWWADAAR